MKNRLIERGNGSSARRVTLVWIVLAWLVSLPAPVRAGRQFVPCEEPEVFPGADVNAVIVQYLDSRSGQSLMNDTTVQLSLLMQREVLFSLVKHRSVGSTQIVAETKECDAANVFAKILGEKPGAVSEIQEGHGVILLWGYIFEEGEDIFLQSYLQFRRRGREETIDLPMGSEPGLTGQLPSNAVAFAPRELNRAELEEITAAYERNVVIRERPDPRARVVPVEIESRLAYFVTDTRPDGWMKVESPQGGFTGWVQARTALRGRLLSQKLPELFFLDGVAGYLSYRVKAERQRPADEVRSRLVRMVDVAFEQYERHAGPSPAPRALAVAKSLQGMLYAMDWDRDDGALERAAAQFDGAAKLVPYNASLRNLEVAARISRTSRKQTDTPAESDEVAKALVRALAADPTNRIAAQNLEKFSAYLKTAEGQTRYKTSTYLDSKTETIQRVVRPDQLRMRAPEGEEADRNR